MLTRESYVKYNSLMLVQGQHIGRVKKMGVVIGESGRGSNITLQNHKYPLYNPSFSQSRFFPVGCKQSSSLWGYIKPQADKTS
jgi:hypothetical protein